MPYFIQKVRGIPEGTQIYRHTPVNGEQKYFGILVANQDLGYAYDSIEEAKRRARTARVRALIEPNDKMPFGKYKGMSLRRLLEKDPEYIARFPQWEHVFREMVVATAQQYVRLAQTKQEAPANERRMGKTKYNFQAMGVA